MAVSDADIQAYVQSVLNNQSLTDTQRADQINSAAAQYGVDRDRLASATGYDLNTVNAYLGANSSTYGGPSGTSYQTSDGALGFSGPYGANSVATPSSGSTLSQSQIDTAAYYRGEKPGADGSYYTSAQGVGAPPQSAPVVQPVTQSPSPISAPPIVAKAPAIQQPPSITPPSYAPPSYTPPPAPVMQQYQKNPYLDQMAAGITQQMTDNMQRQVLPGLRSGAVAAGGFGGSRQGVVEANAVNDFNNSLGNNLTNLYNTDYQNFQNRALQKYQGDQNYNLGQGNLGLGYYNAGNNYNLGLGQLGLGYMNSQQNYDLGLRNNDLNYAQLDANIYNSNFNNALNAANLGLNTYGVMQNSNNNAMNTATNVQNMPLNYNQYFTNAYNQTAGQGGNTSQTASGSPWLGALGGALTGAKLVY